MSAITAPAVGGGVVNTNYEYSLDGGTTWIARSPAAITTPLAIAGLTANTAYSLRLRAVNAGGKGEASSTTAFTTVPAAPTSFSATGVAGDPTKLSVAFTKPSGTITSYQYSTDGGTNWTTASETTSPVVITGLAANTTYSNLKLRAVAAGGNGREVPCRIP